jgi:sugar phosphate permease
VCLFRPGAHVARLPDGRIQKLYAQPRWQILESTFIRCATFYFVRNTQTAHDRSPRRKAVETAV